MQRDARAYLWEVREAAAAIGVFSSGLDLDRYTASELIQSAVERKFEIIGKALNQLSKADPSLAERIPDLAKIVAFRNLLIHGYATVKPATVSGAIQLNLPPLVHVVNELLAGLGEAAGD